MRVEPIRLKYAESSRVSPGRGISGVNNTKVIARAKNIGFVAEAAILYTQLDGTWAERPLSFQKTFSGYGLFTRTDNTFSTTEFALRYTVDGRTFWDNNGGANYHVNSGKPNALGGNVILDKAIARRGLQGGGGFTVTTSWVEGKIFVKKLPVNRRVGIRLSVNDWATFQDTDASFIGNVPVAVGLSQVEVWSFKTPELSLVQSSPDFRFVAFYTISDTAEWFWDNNFGQDYVVSKADFATIE